MSAMPSRARRRATRPIARPASPEGAGASCRFAAPTACAGWWMPTHLEGENRERQHRADPEAPGHVGEIGVRPGSAVRSSGSSAMPQIGQLPGPPGALRVHGQVGSRPAVPAPPPCRQGSGPARPRTWCGSLHSRNGRSAPQLVPVRRLVRVHVHTAHRVLDGERGGAAGAW